jgi:hypothetical protein
VHINQSSIVSNSTFDATSQTIGGGICNFSTANINDSLIGFNHAVPTSNSQYGSYGGGIYNNGTLSINNSSIALNSAEQASGGNRFLARGGGIYNADGIMFLKGSAVYGNQVDGNGAGINNQSSNAATISNSTISDNSAFGNSGIGGGITNFSVINLTNVTITSNTATKAAAGVSQADFDGDAINLSNTIIAGNKVTDNFGGLNSDDVNGPLTSKGFNLIGNTNHTTIRGITTGNLLNVDPMLDPVLRNNGGQTPTHALLSGSPAINVGNNADAPTTDQRGFARIVGGIVDIGAYEFAPVKSRKRIRFF